jgi:catechol 2,3-dioxygenase-like lactoylglutathione lyase family enzyme
MHKSRLSTFVIDCRTSDVDRAARFWSAALGRDVQPPEADSPTYRELRTTKEEPTLLVQGVDHDSRVHIDIEADDQEAEVKRLEALGAKRIEFLKRWWVMEAPTGQRFCVVRLQRGPLGDSANAWNEDGTRAR